MASFKGVVTVALAISIAAILFGPMVTAVSDNTGTQSVTNETVTADIGNYTDLDGYSIVDGSETVYNSSGATMSSGTDYEMGYTNGSIKALSGGDIADASEVKVSYDYEATTGTTTTVIQYGPTFAAVLMLAVLGKKVTEEM